MKRIATHLGLRWEEPDHVLRFAAFHRWSWADWCEPERDIWVLVPGSAQYPAGSVVGYSATTAGRCAFLTDAGRCQVHEVKPTECAVAFGGGPGCRGNDIPYGFRGYMARRRIARAWSRPAAQTYMVRLLETAGVRSMVA